MEQESACFLGVDGKNSDRLLYQKRKYEKDTFLYDPFKMMIYSIG
ncbi:MULTISPECIES: hypothetical protein [Anoxybacillus]|uniref:Uncharacterized protein n=1 Tax=Anoxybacteroides rupiense TaxID=311460 RepID=A0ABT5W1K9_9BACL|nr:MULTISPECIES: hypothetical protein [Anoxybacillus]MBB3906076.1 hypothetical protein [Anoxybacillus rupiensis]MDE8563208.1 hypothetical protein [Anoxybacillus rupiensis]